MIVSDLIKALKKVDQTLEVYAYDETEEVWAGKLEVKEMTQFPYVKGDKPSQLAKKFIVLWGYEY